MRSPDGRPGSATCTHQQYTRRPPGRTSTAPASPTSQTPSAPRSGTSPVRACSSRASWPTRSPSSPSADRSGAVPRPRARPHDVGAAARVELRDRPGVGEQRQPDRERQRLEREQAAPAVAMNGTVCATVVSVQVRPRPRSRRASARGRQWTAAVSGRAERRSPARDRAAQDHELGVERQLGDLARLALALGDHRVVARVELAAELGDGALAARRRPRRSTPRASSGQWCPCG